MNRDTDDVHEWENRVWAKAQKRAWAAIWEARDARWPESGTPSIRTPIIAGEPWMRLAERMGVWYMPLSLRVRAELVGDANV